MGLLSTSQKQNLKLYKYRGGDNSPIYCYILSPLAQFLVNLLPTYIAPNVITFVGLLVSASSTILSVLLNPELNEKGPRWLCLYSAIALFIYQTMDNMDGKQARRTGSSSPLGMIFDHGCDAINAGIFGISLASALGTGWNMGIFFGLWCGFVPFYLQTWEEHHLGEMFLLPINGPTEGILIGMSMCLYSYFYGPEQWHQTLHFPFVSVLQPHLSGWISPEETYLTPFRIMVIVAVTGGLITVMTHIMKVSGSRRAKNLPLLPALLEVVPFVSFFLGSVQWTRHSDIALSTFPCVLITSVFVETACHAMLMTVCSSPIQPWHRL
eukprot:gene667-1287_t